MRSALEVVDSAKVDAPCHEQPGWACVQSVDWAEEGGEEGVLSLAATLPSCCGGGICLQPWTGSPSIGSPRSLQLAFRVSGLQIVGLLSPHSTCKPVSFHVCVYIVRWFCFLRGTLMGTPSVCETVTVRTRRTFLGQTPPLSSAVAPP